MPSSRSQRVVLVERHGPPDVLVPHDASVPEPGAGQVRVRVVAIGVNFGDVQRRRGPYPGAPRPPFLPGLDVAGTIDAVGPGVRALRAGQRVAALPQDGAYAEFVVAPAGLTLPLPSALSFETGAAALTAGITAYNLLRLVGRLRRGERVLVLAAAGGVGGLAVQLARVCGASQVIGAVGSEQKARLVLQAGADVAIDYEREPLAERVRALTGDRGVDLVLDSVGARTVSDGIASLAPFGRLVIFGQSSGPPPPITFGPMFAASQSVLGYNGGAYRRHRPEVVREAGRRVLRLLAEGRLRLTVGARFPLEQAAEAHRLLESRESVGKIVLLPGVAAEEGQCR